jgi:hypothetical protein
MTGGSQFRASYSSLEKRIYFEPLTFDGVTHIETAMARAKANKRGGSLWLPKGIEEPEPKLLSRFFGKIGLEILAHRFMGGPDFDAVLYDAQLDPLRNWTRFGTGALKWPIYRRRLYDENDMFTDNAHPERYQVLHEFDLLVTDTQEWYAVVCLFGEEFTINLGGPETEGYETWLRQHEHASPLYTGKNEPLKSN